MNRRTSLLLLAVIGVLLVALRLAVVGRPVIAIPAKSTAVDAVNSLGIDLLHQASQPGANALLSPYSIQMALVMTCAGADGQTRDEMVRVLHYPKDEAQLNRSFADLQASVNGIMDRESTRAQLRFEQFKHSLMETDKSMPAGWKDEGRTSQQLSELQLYLTNSLPILTTVNLLYGQSGYDFRPDYLKLLADNWQASFEAMDFEHHAPDITAQINSRVQAQTHDRIKGLIPEGALDSLTRLVVVNAIYLKAPWLHSFSADITQPGPFRLPDGAVIQVPTMSQPFPENFFIGYARRGGHLGFLGHWYTVIALPYHSPELQFVILMPDKCNGLPALEAILTPELLADCANLPVREADLSLVKFKLQPPALSLVEPLRALGMNSAFEQGHANFNRTAPFRTDEPLYISGIFHKTFLQVDESGTEASAGMGLARGTYGEDTNVPVKVRIDRPFLFMIQHRPTGACLFLGRITDPR
jgi:serpin B